MNDILRNIWTGLTTATALDQVNLVVGVVGVGLMIRRNLWAFPVGLVAVTVQGVLFFRSRIYADAALQVFFFVTLAWGWWHWVKHRGRARELPVTQLAARGRILVVGAATLATVVWALALGRWTDAVIPWRDAFIASFSVAAQILQARKQVETWPLWVIVNLVAIPSYWSASLAYSAFLYLIYLGLAFAGWLEWQRAMKSAAPRPNHVKRIAIFGTESTGKTSLAERLAAHFGEPWSREYAREFWDSHNGKISAADLEAIGKGQIANEEAAAAQAKRVVFCDTDLLTCMLWNDALFPRACPAWVRDQADERARVFAIYLLCDADVPFVPDPQRCFPDDESRERARSLWRDALVGRDLPFVEITGDWAERERIAIAAVEQVLANPDRS